MVSPPSKTVRAALLFTLLAAAFLWQWVFLGHVFTPGDILNDFYPWKAELANEAVAHNPLLSDQIYVTYPWAEFARRSLWEGRLPLWNPYSSAGVPFMANYESGLYSPLNFFVFAAGPRIGLGLSALLKLILAGLGMYLFLRHWKLREGACLLGGVLATYHLFNVVWLGYSMTHVTIWLPWLLLTIQRLVERPSLRRVGLLALVIAVQLSGGHPESSFHLLLASVVFLAFLLVRRRTHSTPAIAGMGRPALLGISAGAALLAAGLMAVQLIPFAEYALRSCAFQMRRPILDRLYLHPSVSVGQVVTWVFSSYRSELLSASSLSLLIPRYFGMPTLRGSEWGFWNFNERTFYVGVATLLLAGIGLIRPGSRFLRGFAAVLLILCLGLIFELPLFRALVLLPFLSVSINSRLIFVASWCLAMLAALGMDSLISWTGTRGNRAFLTYAAAFLTAAAAIGVWLWRGVPATGAAVAFTRGQIGLFVGLAAAAAFLLCWRVAARRLTPLPLYLLALLAIGDQFYFGIGFNTFVPSPAVADSEIVQFLRSRGDHARMLALGNSLPPNMATHLNLYALRGYDGMDLLDYFRFTKGAAPDADLDDFYLSRPGEIRRDWVLNLLNVQYLVTPPDLELTGDAADEWLPGGIRVRQIYSGRDGRVYENLDVLGRAFIARQASYYPTKEAMLAAMESAQWNYRQTVLLTDDPEEPEMRSTEHAPADNGVAKLVDYRPEEILVETQSAFDGYLVLGELNYPGWKAWLDGERVDILTADYVLRAVRLPSGKHRIRMAYEPASFYVGLTLSILFAFVVTLFLLTPDRD